MLFARAHHFSNATSHHASSIWDFGPMKKAGGLMP